jgi:hypothetical protein
MLQLRQVAGRTFTTLWVVVTGFLALAMPAHAIFESPLAALFAQAVGALLLGSAFALRGGIRQQYERLASFLERSRGLRAVVRTLAVSAIAKPSRHSGHATGGSRTATAKLDRSGLSHWELPGGSSSAASAETSPQTAASAPHQPIPPFPTTTA